jgi:hypothetical protein
MTSRITHLIRVRGHALRQKIRKDLQRTMMFLELRRKPALTSGLLLLLSGFTGWSVFNLQVVSMIRLLEEAGISSLPTLMIAQALISWILLRTWGNVAHGSTRFFFGSAIFSGALIAWIAHDETLGRLASESHQSVLLYGGLYIFSQIIIASLRMGVHVMFSRRISLLSNPQLSTQLAISEECGLLVGVSTVLFLGKDIGAVQQLVLSIVPFVLALITFGLLGTESKNIAERSSQSAVEFLKTLFGNTSKSSRRNPPFFFWLIGLFFVVSVLKSLQWFGMALGLTQAAAEGSALLPLFSRLALIQSVATLLILVASLRFSQKIASWGMGFRTLLNIQGGFAALLACAPIPPFLMGGEVIRKVAEHGFLGRSLQLLTASLPESSRFESRHLLERWCTTSGTAVGGFFAFLLLAGKLPTFALFLTMIGFAVLGRWIQKRLFATLNDFHVAHLRQADLGSVLQACQVLGNPESKLHYAALTGLLERNPRPVIRKALLSALGRGGHTAVINSILPHVTSDREDVQITAVRALNHFQGHEVNFFLLKSLREMVRSPGAMRLSVIRTITHRLGRLVVPYLLEVLESRPDPRVESNAVEILGEIAKNEDDEDLLGYLTKFLDVQYNRRTRGNAVVALYGHRIHGTRAIETLDRLWVSESSQDLDTAAYVAGVCTLHGLEGFIWELSEKIEHRNTTLLCSLLRLGNPEVPRLLAQWVTGDEDAIAITALNRLSTVKPNVRAMVFFEVIERHPEKLSLVILRMRRSQRDFESDRQLIREEVARLGLVFVEPEEDPAPLVSPWPKTGT